MRNENESSYIFWQGTPGLLRCRMFHPSFVGPKRQERDRVVGPQIYTAYVNLTFLQLFQENEKKLWMDLKKINSNKKLLCYKKLLKFGIGNSIFIK